MKIACKKNKNVGNSWKIAKTRTPFLAQQGQWLPKKVRKQPFSPTHCFNAFPTSCWRFPTWVLVRTPKKALFYRKSYSKGPTHALEKVLTKQTPSTCSLLRVRTGVKTKKRSTNECRPVAKPTGNKDTADLSTVQKHCPSDQNIGQGTQGEDKLIHFVVTQPLSHPAPMYEHVCGLRMCELFFASIFMCYACDQETVKWLEGEARILPEGEKANCDKKTTSKTPEGRSATFRVQVFFSIFYGLNCCTISRNISF